MQGPSRNGTTRRPSKKPRCDRKGVAKQKTGPQVGPADEAHSGASNLDLEVRLQSEEKGPSGEPQDVAEEKMEPRRSEVFQPHLPQKVEEEEEEKQEEGGEETGTAGASTSLQMEPEEASGQASEPDNSIFLNEDSNQPLPMDRFFGSVAFTQVRVAAVGLLQGWLGDSESWESATFGGWVRGKRTPSSTEGLNGSSS